MLVTVISFQIGFSEISKLLICMPGRRPLSPGSAVECEEHFLLHLSKLVCFKKRKKESKTLNSILAVRLLYSCRVGVHCIVYPVTPSPCGVLGSALQMSRGCCFATRIPAGGWGRGTRQTPSCTEMW